MNILFVGDVVGSQGRDMITEYVPKLKEKYRPHITIINGKMQQEERELRKRFIGDFLRLVHRR